MCVKVTAMTRNTNDNMLNIYLSSLIRAIIALHELMNNKIQNQIWDKAPSEKKESKKEDEEKTVDGKPKEQESPKKKSS